jgi:hypothetical protein
MMTGLVAHLADIDLERTGQTARERREAVAVQLGVELEVLGDTGSGFHQPQAFLKSRVAQERDYFFARHTSGFFPCLRSIMLVNSIREGVTSRKPKSGA